MCSHARMLQAQTQCTKHHLAIFLLHDRLMPNGPDDRRYSAAGVLALSFGPPDGHIRLLLTQEKANKSRWRKKMVERDLWRTMHPFNLPGRNAPIQPTRWASYLHMQSPSVNGGAAAHTRPDCNSCSCHSCSLLLGNNACECFVQHLSAGSFSRQLAGNCASTPWAIHMVHAHPVCNRQPCRYAAPNRHLKQMAVHSTIS